MSNSKSNPKDRRAGSERRSQTRRRRHADSRILNIELCHSVLRTALLVEDAKSDKPVLITESIRWRKEAKDLKSKEGLTELTIALKEYVVRHRLAGCRVSFALSSTLCVNRATSGPIAKVEQEILQLQERSQLYLALGPGSKTTAVGRKQIDARHVHALLTVTSSETIDLLVQAAESVGLVVDVVESALVALSRLHGFLHPDDHTPAILAQLDEDKFEIGVSRNGQLLQEYRPASDTTTSRLGETINTHFTRFQRFCQRQYGVGAMEITRMWLVGEDNELEATNAQTDLELETKVLDLSAVNDLWTIGEDSPISAELGAALGLSLRGYAEDTGVSPNLMDQLHERAKEPIRPFLVKAGGVIAATLLLAGSLWMFNLEQEYELSALRAKVIVAKPIELRGRMLSNQLRADTIEIEHLTLLEEKMPQQKINPLIDRLSHCLPDDVWLKKLNVNDFTHTTVVGASYTESGVYDYMHHLEKVPGFDEVAILGTGIDQTAKGPATHFDIDITLAPQADKE